MKKTKFYLQEMRRSKIQHDIMKYLLQYFLFSVKRIAIKGVCTLIECWQVLCKCKYDEIFES